MSSRTIKKSILFNTSSGSDVQGGQGVLSVAGLESVRLSDVVSITQVKYRAQVSQVVTVGGTTYTPTGDTMYKVVVYDPLRKVSGYTESPKTYSYKTPVDITTLGASAALQREAIHLQLVAKINADVTCHATAATLTSGNGFTVTDNATYYPAYAQNMSNVQGANEVYTVTNNDGTGFVDNFTVSTAAVASFGVGATLAATKPVMDFVFGNVVAGEIEAPPVTIDNAPAVSGQNYDGFVIEDLKIVDGVTLGGQKVFQTRLQVAYVDNGTGSSTANLTGFKAFERSMLSYIFSLYKDSSSTIYWMGSNGVTCGGLATGLASGTSLDQNSIHFGNGFATAYYPLGTSTLVALTSGNNGVNCVLDAAAGEGVELSASVWANSMKSAIVGKSAFSIYAKVTIDDVTGLNPMWVGFRKKEAANTTYTSYADFALVGLGNATGDIFTSTEISTGSGNTNTDTTQNWADGETHTLEVRVAVSGAVTFFIDGYKPTVTQTFSLPAGLEVIPVFCYALQTSDIGTPSVLEGAFLPTDSWKV